VDSRKRRSFHLQKVLALAGTEEPSAIKPAAFRKYRKLNLLLNALDRLEVRGRDSAGIQLTFILNDEKEVREAIRHIEENGSAEDYQRAIQLKPVTGETLPAGRELSAGEILALMTACQNDESPAGTRDAAIIALLYAAGLRREEVVSLSLGSYDRESGELVVMGKRNKQRKVYLNNGSLDAMNDWLDIRGADGDARPAHRRACRSDRRRDVTDLPRIGSGRRGRRPFGSRRTAAASWSTSPRR
jgi:integrase